MTDKSYHYLFSSASDASELNRQMFRLSQQPSRWASKGMRLKRDASIIYKASESARLFIVSELEKINFNFSRFYRWQLQNSINTILECNQDCFLPDFDTYYLLMHLSLENVLKAIWLDRHPEKIGFDQLHKELKTHDLRRLSAEIELELSPSQERILSEVSELFLGYSRYPIKNRVKQPSGSEDFDFGEKSFDAVCIDCLENYYAKDKEILDALFKERLQERVDQVFANRHERMLSTFDFKEPSKANQFTETEK